MQELGLEGDPHEAIASKFARIFSDRMMQKRELLERVRRGEDLSELLAPEVDAQVEVPVVSGGDATPLSKVRKPTERSGKSARKRGRYAFLIAFLLASLSGAGVGAYLRTRETASAGPHGRLAVVALPAGPPAESRQAEAEHVEEVPPAPAADEYIVISVDTDPDGVKVRVDGEERGTTPVDVRVKRGERPLEIQLAHVGFTTHKVDVVPDRDQRLYFALVKGENKIVRVRTPPKQDRKPGFRRFD
jgi:hypothetical protein